MSKGAHGSLISGKDLVDGDSEDLISRDGGLQIYGLARNAVSAAAGTYDTTEVLGFCVITQPSADNTSLTPVDGSAVANVPAAMFVVGNIYPLHCSELTVGTGGVFLLFLP